jgi:NAD(P)-dependent dehydrogenase (short-subunit alcohol dehydrogenase family)
MQNTTAAGLAVQHKVVLITGVTAGVGHALATTFTEFGATVIGTGRRKEIGAKLAAQIAAPHRFVFMAGDVTDGRRCGQIVEDTISRFGRIDILINNAGQEGPIRPAHEISEEQWDSVLDTNLRGTFSFCRRVIPHMQAAGGGCIVNVSSTLAVEGAANLAPYASSKAAIVQLTRSLAVEYLLDDIRVNAVLIAAVPSESSTRTRSGMARTVDPAVGERVIVTEPTQLHRILTQKARSVATSIALLCADEACAITGATVAMDRALSAGMLTSMALARSAAGVWT